MLWRKAMADTKQSAARCSASRTYREAKPRSRRPSGIELGFTKAIISRARVKQHGCRNPVDRRNPAQIEATKGKRRHKRSDYANNAGERRRYGADDVVVIGFQRHEGCGQADQDNQGTGEKALHVLPIPSKAPLLLRLPRW